jgi:drug/metabolite transporter (DMT)-like permease
MAVAPASIASLCWGVADLMRRRDAGIGGSAVATTYAYLSIVAVLGSLFPLVTVALAHVRLHERLSGGQRAGLGLALAGVLAITGGWVMA